MFLTAVSSSQRYQLSSVYTEFGLLFGRYSYCVFCIPGDQISQVNNKKKFWFLLNLSVHEQQDNTQGWPQDACVKNETMLSLLTTSQFALQLNLTCFCNFIVFQTSLPPNFASLFCCFRQQEEQNFFKKQLSGWSNNLLGRIHVSVSSKWSEAALQLVGWFVCPHKIFMVGGGWGRGEFRRTFWQLFAWKFIHHLSPTPQCQNV